MPSHTFRRAWFNVRAALPIGPSAKLEPDGLTPVHGGPSRYSMTAFNGTPAAWHQYLDLPKRQRYANDWSIRIDWAQPDLNLCFTATSPSAAAFSQLLQDLWPCLTRHAARKPHIHEILIGLVHGNPSNRPGQIRLVCSEQLPSESTREVHLHDEATNNDRVFIVLNQNLVGRTLEHAAALPDDASDAQKLGVAMLLLPALLSSLAYPNRPRDRFVERIDITRRVYQLMINVLYDDRRLGRLIPNQAGRVYLKRVSQDTGIPVDKLQTQDHATKLLGDLGMLLADHPNPLNHDNASIIVREFLDTRYLRLSVADLLPPVAPGKQPMPARHLGTSTDTPRPEIGRFGIVDKEDLNAWKKVANPFKRQGFVLVRQLGIGQFGRVYEAINLLNGALPRRVAIKIDRLTARGHNPIQDPVHAMTHANKLALSPHIIRLYDTGHLPRYGLNYHILQLLDGETLDDLLGITGREHASITVPRGKHTSDSADQEVRRALSVAHGETWRIRGEQSVFARALRLNQMLDLFTSILLWIEEIHGLGYAINDLKNGNLMLTRSGQLKGIDLDTYAPAFNHTNRLVDFKFLAVAMMLFLLNAGQTKRVVPVLSGGVLNDASKTRDLIQPHWPFQDVALLSNNRVQTHEVLDTLVQIIVQSNNGRFAQEPERFTHSLNAFILLKRRVAMEQIVLD